MTEPEAEKKIYVDSDWKQEAAEEKARLEQESKSTEAGAKLPEASFLELVNMLVTQAAIGLGGFQTPEGQRVPPDLALAKHFIDLIGILQEKSGGNLTDAEQSALASALYELRMRFVDVTANPPGAPSPESVGGESK